MYFGMHYVDRRASSSVGVSAGRDHPRFYDKLKTISRGYATLDYEFRELPGIRAGASRHAAQRRGGRRLQVIIHRDKAYEWGRKIAEKLKELIPRQLFEVVIQPRSAPK